MADEAPVQTHEQAAATAAAAGANRGATREEIREDMAAAMATQRPAAGVLSDADKDDIADRMIVKLEGRGAFAPEPPPESAAPGTVSASVPGSVDGNPPAAPDPQPRKQTLAERFHGRRPA